MQAVSLLKGIYTRQCHLRPEMFRMKKSNLLLLFIYLLFGLLFFHANLKISLISAPDLLRFAPQRPCAISSLALAKASFK